MTFCYSSSGCPTVTLSVDATLVWDVPVWVLSLDVFGVLEMGDTMIIDYLTDDDFDNRREAKLGSSKYESWEQKNGTTIIENWT